MTNPDSVTVQDATNEVPTCANQARATKAASKQLEQLKVRLSQNQLNAVFSMFVYSFDCKHDGKDAYHVEMAGTGSQGITPAGKTAVIASLEQVLAHWKKTLE